MFCGDSLIFCSLLVYKHFETTTFDWLPSTLLHPFENQFYIMSGKAASEVAKAVRKAEPTIVR
jgi:hypothetical protein